MKKIILSLVLLLAVAISYGQREYNTFTVEPYIGATKVRDITSVELGHVGLTARYMLTPKFGFALSGTRIEMQDSKDLMFTSGKFYGVANVGRIFELENILDNRYTILLSVGGDYTELSQTQEAFHRLSNFHLAGAIDNEFRITDKFFMSAGLEVTTGINHRPAATTIDTETTSIVNFRLKAVIALGNKKQHADWYIPEPQRDTIIEKHFTVETVQPIITNQLVREYVAVSKEYVYFDHDASGVPPEGFDNIERIAAPGDGTITVTAYCSNVGAVEYNRNLAERRADAVIQYLTELEVPMARIKKNIIGIDYERSEKIPEMVRRVVLEVE